MVYILFLWYGDFRPTPTKCHPTDPSRLHPLEKLQFPRFNSFFWPIYALIASTNKDATYYDPCCEPGAKTDFVCSLYFRLCTLDRTMCMNIQCNSPDPEFEPYQDGEAPRKGAICINRDGQIRQEILSPMQIPEYLTYQNAFWCDRETSDCGNYTEASTYLLELWEQDDSSVPSDEAKDDYLWSINIDFKDMIQYKQVNKIVEFDNNRTGMRGEPLKCRIQFSYLFYCEADRADGYFWNWDDCFADNERGNVIKTSEHNQPVRVPYVIDDPDGALRFPPNAKHRIE